MLAMCHALYVTSRHRFGVRHSCDAPGISFIQQDCLACNPGPCQPTGPGQAVSKSC